MASNNPQETDSDGSDSDYEEITNIVGTPGTEDEKKILAVIKWKGNAQEVSIGGSFTNWELIPMEMVGGEFVVGIYLPKGEYLYKFHVDGLWQHDPNHATIVNEDGYTVNVVAVFDSDFGDSPESNRQRSNASTQTEDYIPGPSAESRKNAPPPPNNPPKKKYHLNC